MRNTVVVPAALARVAGPVVVHAARSRALCAAGCRASSAAGPGRFAAAGADHGLAGHDPGQGSAPRHARAEVRP